MQRARRGKFQPKLRLLDSSRALVSTRRSAPVRVLTCLDWHRMGPYAPQM